MSNSPATQLQIGEWRLDPAASRIYRGNDAVQLEARTLRLLLHLAGKPGEIVSIDELLDQVWPDVTVSPDSVYQAVASLRRQLGDDPRRPRYIATAPRLGYRMVAKVSPFAEDPIAEVESISAKPRHAVWIALPMALVVFAGAAVALGLGRSNPPAIAAPRSATVGVMPFLDMTNAMDQEVFVDNLTEDMVDRLSRVPGLRTPEPRSSFALKGLGLTASQAAQKLGVDFVLDGSVRDAGETIQLTARLLRADTGFVMWSKTYEAPASGLDAVQLDIITEVARQAISTRGA
jgi:transcriptional activator of cad operon